MYVYRLICPKHRDNVQEIADVGWGQFPVLDRPCGWVSAGDMDPCREQMQRSERVIRPI